MNTNNLNTALYEKMATEQEKYTKPAAAKGQYVRSCVVATTMGPGVKINPARFVAVATTEN